MGKLRRWLYESLLPISHLKNMVLGSAENALSFLEKKKRRNAKKISCRFRQEIHQEGNLWNLFRVRFLPQLDALGDGYVKIYYTE